MPLVLDKFLAKRLMRRGTAEKNSIWHDARTPSADLKHLREERDEQEFRLAGLRQRQQVTTHLVLEEFSGERRIGHNERVLVALGVVLAQ